MTYHNVIIFAMALSSAQTGCAPILADAEMRANNKVYRDTSDPKRIHFVVNGDPGLEKYPAILELEIPMHEKIREGMHRHAGDVLAELGWCKNGFLGPETVWAMEYARLTSHFFVECKE
ncbi:hypothetical protein [Thioalbus denitrificans]|uniref:hypothetical protein n=1 Tax=Thioalbus denitrificans TaxID=547122 RepID=UPI0011C06CC2|nr:hypothetical protein [Thioalbus denitrificans]